MANNPLQQYFRQPKVYITLPSHGAYNSPADFDGDPDHLPVFGMTGMDEIIAKTPDALLTGESTVKIISSCVPGIKDPWSLTLLDLDTVLTGIRIATYGNELDVDNICDKCGTHAEYTFNLSNFIDYYATVKYDNKVLLGDLTVNLKPLTYRQSSNVAQQNFQLQQRLKQVMELESEEEKNKLIADLYSELAKLQNEIFILGIESITTRDGNVSEYGFIREWVENTDSKFIADIRSKVEKNQTAWRSPAQKVKCETCDHESSIVVTLDQSDFFVTA
jgi:hypothetical protein